jgi:multidrug resistance efflux pump
MRWFGLPIILLALSSPSAWAQSGDDEADVALYRKLIEEAKEVNTAMTASNARLAKSLEGYRKEIRLLRSDRDQFEAERRSVAERVAELKAQIAGLTREAAELYGRNALYVEEYTRIQREWATDNRLPQNGSKP